MSHTLTARSAPPERGSRPAPSRQRRPIESGVAGLTAIAGVVLCIVGAVLIQVVADVDVYDAMETASSTDRAQLLNGVAAAQTPLVAGFVIWMIAFPVTAAASLLLSRLGRQSALTDLIRYAVTAAMGAILVFLSLFITFVVVIAPAHVAGQDVIALAHAIGYTASTIDWVVTAIVLGLAPAAAVYSGRGIWAPRWLVRLAGVTVLVTMAELGTLLVDERALAFPLVPVGLALIASAGVCAVRRSGDPAAA